MNKRWIKNYKDIALDLISYVGMFWLFVEIASYSTAGAVDTFFKSVSVFFIAFIIVFVIALLKNKPKTSFGYHLRGKDNFIEIRVGDAFDNRGAFFIILRHPK
jgi:hypothetical protein